MATPSPAQRNIGMSLGISPKATISPASTPSGPATSAIPVALLSPRGRTSMSPLLVE